MIIISEMKENIKISDEKNYILSLLIKEHIIKSMCLSDSKNFIDQILLLQKDIYGTIVLFIIYPNKQMYLFHN